MTKFKRIVICCPGDVQISGGVNSLHNLCRALMQNGYNASIYYLNANEEIVNNEHYLLYRVNRTRYIEDSQDTLLIIPETLVPFLFEFKHIGKMIYWLGLSLYIKTPSWRMPYNFKPLRKLIKCRSYYGYSAGRLEDFKRRLNEYAKSHLPLWGGDILHMSNSNFVASYCHSKGVKAYVLHNPIRDEFYDSDNVAEERKRIVLLGPKTPVSILRKLKSSLPDFSIIKIRKMSFPKVFDLMSKAMIFVEIGNFSGRDRMPREAALRGCAVIINTRGSAADVIDYNIDSQYKIDENNKVGIIKKVKECVGNYQLHFDNQLSFRNQLFREREGFIDRTNDIFENLVYKSNGINELPHEE